MDETVLKLLLAVVVGGLIGAEREIRVGAGLRTLMVICVGATLFTIYSGLFTPDQGDPRRIAAAVVTGVGFLGAGMILRHEGGIYGLTTAATVWLVAALGMGIGMGEYFMVGIATILAMIVLVAIPFLQQISNVRRTLVYEAICPLDNSLYDEITGIFKRNKLRVRNRSMAKKDGQMICTWQVYGSPKNHDLTMAKFLEDPEVKEFRVV